MEKIGIKCKNAPLCIKKNLKKRCLYKHDFLKIMPTGEIESGYKKIFRYAVSDSVKTNLTGVKHNIYNLISYKLVLKTISFFVCKNRPQGRNAPKKSYIQLIL